MFVDSAEKIPHSTGLAEVYYELGATIYRKKQCVQNNLTFIEKCRDIIAAPLLGNLFFVYLSFPNDGGLPLGKTQIFPHHMFLMVWENNQYYVLDYDSHDLMHFTMPLKILAIDYLASLLNIDVTVNHLNELIDNPGIKSKKLPQFQIIKIKDWSLEAIGSFDRKTEPGTAPMLNFIEYLQFLRTSPPNVDDLAKKYANSSIIDKDVLSNERLTDIQQIRDFLTLLKQYYFVDFAQRRSISPREQMGLPVEVPPVSRSRYNYTKMFLELTKPHGQRPALKAEFKTMGHNAADGSITTDAHFVAAFSFNRFNINRGCIRLESLDDTVDQSQEEKQLAASIIEAYEFRIGPPLENTPANPPVGTLSVQSYQPPGQPAAKSGVFSNFMSCGYK